MTGASGAVHTNGSDATSAVMCAVRPSVSSVGAAASATHVTGNRSDFGERPAAGAGTGAADVRRAATIPKAMVSSAKTA